MSKPNMEEKIQAFAEDTVRASLSKDQLSYPERMEMKLNELREKAQKNMKPDRKEETEEVAGYVKEYMNQLMMEEGLSEEDAFFKATAIFKAERPLSDDERKAQERQAYYEQMDPKTEESIGLGYASYLFLGIVIGAMVGIFGQILYADTVFGLVFYVMLGLGILLGMALGLNKHNQIISQK